VLVLARVLVGQLEQVVVVVEQGQLAPDLLFFSRDLFHFPKLALLVQI